MAQLIKVRPTKIELIKLRRRLTLASRIQKIVKDRLSILMLEFLQLARETVSARMKLLEEFSATYQALSITVGYQSYVALEKEFAAIEKALEIVTGSRNVAGARIPSFELRGARGRKGERARVASEKKSVCDTGGDDPVSVTRCRSRG